MKQDSPDPTLAPFFERLRAADHRTLPSFARQCRAAQPARVRLRRPIAVLLLAGVPLLTLAGLRLRTPGRTAETAAAPTDAAPAFASWESPTAALLQNYTEVPVTALPVPALGATWTDELLPAGDIVASR